MTGQPSPSPAVLTVRPVDPDSPLLAAWLANARLVFKDREPLTDEVVDFRRGGYAGQRLSAAMDGDEVVGTLRSWDTALTVPGGRVTADAVSAVTVRPTHRRRGAMSALLRADLAAAKERGTPTAVLIASEAAIYGRFGFGAATETATWTVDVRRARMRADAPSAGRVDVVAETQLRSVAPTVYAAARRPGAIDRADRWWDLLLGVLTPPGAPHRPHVAVLHTGPDGAPDGYLRYHADERWEERVCHTVVHVDDLEATTPAAYADLWRYLMELDLVATLTAQERAVDEVLPHLLVDPRAARRTSSADFLWTRVLDPAAVLGARTYRHAGTVGVLEVVDDAGWARGCWSLEVDDDGRADVAATTATPDLSLPVDVLGAVWLGGGDLLAATAAGRTREHRPGAAARWAAAVRSLPAPWTSTWF